MVLRSPSPDELRLLYFLSRCAGIPIVAKRLKVADMNDGGMGSLRLHLDGSDTADAIFGKQASACQFTDEDGIEVIASLNLDQHGSLFELDIWKTDYGELVRIPNQFHEVS